MERHTLKNSQTREPGETVRYAWIDRVTAIWERERVAGGRKAKDGTAEILTVSEGYAVQVGDFAFGVGAEPPPFKVGDMIKITMEKTDVTFDSRSGNGGAAGREHVTSAEAEGVRAASPGAE